jgi:carbamoyltransferase
MYILGISAFYHDSAASIIYNGEIIAAVQEERFTRKKHDSSFPYNSIKYCLKEAGINGSELINIVFYEKPILKFERLLETYLAFAPKGFKSFLKSMPLWIKEKLFQKKNLIDELSQCLSLNKNIVKKKILFCEHHLSHAASAFYPSPFETSAILTLDGVGEWTTTSFAIGNEKNIKLIEEIHFPHSLGLLYSAFTYFTGFKVNSGEYKMMGLAPYGEPKYVELIKNNLIKIAEDGSFKLNMKYFDYAAGLTMTSEKFNNLFGGPPRKPYSSITQREMDLAASVQKVIEDIIIKIALNIKNKTGEKNLCLAGGVALNCVANGVLQNEKIFENIWIQPAAGDAGGSLGAALATWHIHHQSDRKIILSKDKMKCSYLGPQFSNEEVEFYLKEFGAKYLRLDNEKLLDQTVEALENQKTIGWMQGRAEFGPRALGNRSIIGDPRSPIMQKKLNLKIKFRENFRPFAPAILSENLNEWFDFKYKSPYMLLVGKINSNKQLKLSNDQKLCEGLNKLDIIRSQIPAITHVDNSARIQTVEKENGIFYDLIKKFYKKTNCPIIINTSFNIRGEPPVNCPIDAYKCFMLTDLDILVIGNFILKKEEQFSKNISEKIFKKEFTINENLVKFSFNDETVKKVTNFYDEAPFPSYEINDDKSSIQYKGDKNFLAREFKKFIGHNKNILEVGCGTGQLSIYFALGNNNKVFALDPTLNSINLGKDFTKKNKIKNITFVNADLFEDVFQNESFDFIWSNGVLHHTKNPKLAFDIISKYLKKNGYILIGLYNKYGRLKTLFRRLLYKIFGKSIVLFLDPTLRNIKKDNDDQIKAWIRDQYEHPLESLHTFDEVLDWFKENDIEYISSIPKCNLNENNNKNLFQKTSKGSYLSRFFSQISMLFNNLGDDGGIFVVIGKKN